MHAPRIQVVMVAGPRPGYAVPLRPGEELVLGRDPGVAQFVVSGASDVSRAHAVVLFEQATTGDDVAITLEDIGSMNGTYGRGGARLAPGVRVALAVGDSFHLAHAGIEIRVERLD